MLENDREIWKFLRIMGNVEEWLGMIMKNHIFKNENSFKKEDRDKERKEGMYGLLVKVCVGMLWNDRG